MLSERGAIGFVFFFQETIDQGKSSDMMAGGWKQGEDGSIIGEYSKMVIVEQFLNEWQEIGRLFTEGRNFWSQIEKGVKIHDTSLTPIIHSIG